MNSATIDKEIASAQRVLLNLSDTLSRRAATQYIAELEVRRMIAASLSPCAWATMDFAQHDFATRHRY